MHKASDTEEQIIGVLKQAAAGVRVADVIRKHGISEQCQQPRSAGPSSSRLAEPSM